MTENFTKIQYLPGKIIRVPALKVKQMFQFPQPEYTAKPGEIFFACITTGDFTNKCTKREAAIPHAGKIHTGCDTIGRMLHSILLPAFLLGLAYCAPFGVVNVEAMRRGLAHGFYSALRVEIGSLAGDAAWALLALSGAAFVAQNAVVRLVLGVVGVLFLLHLAFQALRDARHGRPIETAASSSRGDFNTGIVLSLSNPFAIVFWLGVGTTALYMQNAQPQFTDFALFFAAYMAGALVWAIGYSIVIGFGKRFTTPALFRWVDLTCGLSLLYLGGHFAWQLMREILI